MFCDAFIHKREIVRITQAIEVWVYSVGQVYPFRTVDLEMDGGKLSPSPLRIHASVHKSDLRHLV